MECEPAGVSSHDLDDHDAVVACGGGVDSVERFGGDGDGGLEAEGDVRSPEVVVDGFGYADAVDALIGEWFGAGHGAVASDDDECFDAVDLEVGQADIGDIFEADGAVGVLADGILLWVCLVGGAEDGAAHGEDVGDIVGGEWSDAVFDEAEESVFDAEDFDAVVDGVFGDGSDDGVEPRAVASSGEDADSFEARGGDLGGWHVGVYREEGGLGVRRLCNVAGVGAFGGVTE